MIEYLKENYSISIMEIIMKQATKHQETIKNIVDQMIDDDVPDDMTISEFVYSYFESSYLNIIDPMVEIVVDNNITIHQIESVIYAFKQRNNSTKASEIHSLINKTYGRKII